MTDSPSQEDRKTSNSGRRLYEMGRREVLNDLMSICGELPCRDGMPRHLLLIDLHKYAKDYGIKIDR